MQDADLEDAQQLGVAVVAGELEAVVQVPSRMPGMKPATPTTRNTIPTRRAAVWIGAWFACPLCTCSGRDQNRPARTLTAASIPTSAARAADDLLGDRERGGGAGGGRVADPRHARVAADAEVVDQRAVAVDRLRAHARVGAHRVLHRSSGT